MVKGFCLSIFFKTVKSVVAEDTLANGYDRHSWHEDVWFQIQETAFLSLHIIIVFSPIFFPLQYRLRDYLSAIQLQWKLKSSFL